MDCYQPAPDAPRTTTHVAVPATADTCYVKPYGENSMSVAYAHVAAGPYVAHEPHAAEAGAVVAGHVATFLRLAAEHPAPLVETFRAATAVISLVPHRDAGHAWHVVVVHPGAPAEVLDVPPGGDLATARRRAAYALARRTTDFRDDLSVREACAYVGEAPGDRAHGAGELLRVASLHRAWHAAPAGVGDRKAWAVEHAREHALG